MKIKSSYINSTKIVYKVIKSNIQKYACSENVNGFTTERSKTYHVSKFESLVGIINVLCYLASERAQCCKLSIASVIWP